MKYLIKGTLFLVCMLCFLSCNKPNKRSFVNRGFYYWKSRFKLNEKDEKLISAVNSKRIYIKFFDVDWDENTSSAMPYATSQIESTLPEGIEIVPTIYITNKTFNQLKSYELYTLSYQLHNKVTELIKCFDSRLKVREVQIDCDWTESTKENYFNLLARLKESLNNDSILLSSTIRLHQVKYFEKTGVPPVDRGILMFYNMGHLDDFHAENSIFNETEAKKYLVNFDQYPLKLDLALPIFSWAVVFHNENVTHLITDFDPVLVENENLEKISENTFKATKAIKVNSGIIAKGDIIRYEILDPELALRAAALIEPHLKQDTINVVLFDFNDLNFKRFNENDIEEIYSYFN
jgi:hypothetical protein